MTGAIYILIFTVITGLMLWMTHKPDAADSPSEKSEKSDEPAEPEVCCGMHEVCEKFPVDKPVYFDDEELDAFKGRGADDYSPEEIETFRDVLYTLIPSDVAPWGASLSARGVEMPAPIRDEWIMLVNEAIAK